MKKFESVLGPWSKSPRATSFYWSWSLYSEVEHSQSHKISSSFCSPLLKNNCKISFFNKSTLQNFSI